jgi:hypothetical protein
MIISKSSVESKATGVAVAVLLDAFLVLFPILTPHSQHASLLPYAS